MNGKEARGETFSASAAGEDKMIEWGAQLFRVAHGGRRRAARQDKRLVRFVNRAFREPAFEEGDLLGRDSGETPASGRQASEIHRGRVQSSSPHHSFRGDRRIRSHWPHPPNHRSNRRACPSSHLQDGVFLGVPRFLIHGWERSSMQGRSTMI